MSTNLDVTAVEKAFDTFKKNELEPFLNDTADLTTQIEVIIENRNTRAYSFVKGLVELALDVSVNNSGDGFVVFLAKRGITPAKGSQNEFGPLIRAVFAKKTVKGWIVPNEAKNYIKYACCVRHIIGQLQAGKLVLGDVEDYIAGYAGGLRQMEADDRKAHPNQSAQKAYQSTVERGEKAEPKSVIGETFDCEEGQYAKLWGYVANGEFVVKAVSVIDSDDEIASLNYKLGQTIPK